MENVATYRTLENVGIITPAQALQVFGANFLDETTCRDWILKRLYPGGVFCPGCSRQVQNDSRLQSFWNLKRIRCKACGKFFAAGSGTFISGCHMGFDELYLLALLIGLKMCNQDIAGILGKNPETIRLWRARFDAVDGEKAQNPKIA